jgi:phage shock protein C
MFCSHCGKEMDPAARFCPACGAITAPVMAGRAPFPGQLTRPRYPRMIAGVCSGFALHYGWDLSLVRVIAVLALIFSGGTAMLAYFAAWIIIPEAPYSLPGASGAMPGPNGAGSGGPIV